MFGEVINTSPLLETVVEDSSDDSHKVVFRALDEDAWMAALCGIVVTYEEGSFPFGISFRKEFFGIYNEDTKAVVPSFCWVVLVWGDADEALEFFEDEVVAAAAAPPPKPMVVPSIEEENPEEGRPTVSLRREVLRTAKGNRIIKTTVPLPGVRTSDRNMAGPKDRTKKLSDMYDTNKAPHRFAYADTIDD